MGDYAYPTIPRTRWTNGLIQSHMPGMVSRSCPANRCCGKFDIGGPRTAGSPSSATGIFQDVSCVKPVGNRVSSSVRRVLPNETIFSGILYGLGLLPLVEWPQAANPTILQPFYADKNRKYEEVCLERR